MDAQEGRTADVLLVEDNPGDRRLVEIAFEDGQFRNRLHAVADGREALEFIHQRGRYEDAPRPDLVLLDLHVPAPDGEELLHEIKHHPELADVPVIVLTGVDDDYVEAKDLDHDADEDAVLEKPLDVDEFLETVLEFDGFQLSIVRAAE